MKTHFKPLLAALIAFFGSSVSAGTHGHHAHGEQPSPALIIGKPGNIAEADRTIAITMDDDMRFSPERVEVRTGEIIRFSIQNVGQLDHEMVIGSMGELHAHAQEMRDGKHMSHDEPNMANLAPGETGDIVWQFTQPGAVDFACLIPGHFEAGMQGQIIANGTD